MIESPWLNSETLRLIQFILNSYKLAFGKDLLAIEKTSPTLRLLSQELFSTPIVVLAHDGAIDPRINYCNSQGLKLWSMRWEQIFGMPSRLTAPIEQRNERNLLLKKVLETNSIVGYQGLRMDSLGRRFLIRNASIWTIWDEQNFPCGQAAAFSSWDYI